ncbi:MAG TPA: MFS transporter [Pilimelia sp.]|nr:MFS transporter [Pilimelia sp.]
MRGIRRWARETTGGLPATFWFLWTGTLINRAGAFVIVFLAIYLTSERGFAVSYAGLVLGLYGAGGAVGTMLGGALADRWGRRPTLLTAHTGAVIMMVGLGLADGRLAIAAGALLLGVFAEGARPAFAAMMVDVVPERDRLRAFSLNYWAINLGFAVSAVLAGLVAEAGYLVLFLGDAATTAVTALIVFVAVRETRPPSAPAAARPGTPAGLRAVLADRVFLGYVLLNLAVALIFIQHLSTLPIAMAADGIPPATYGMIIALNGVLIVSGQLLIPRLIRGRDRSRTLAVATAVVGLGFGLTAVAETPIVYAVTVLIWTFGEMLHSPSNATLMAELSPTELRGRYQGVLALSWQVASFTAPVLGGYVQQHAGNATLWLGSAALAAVAAVGQLLSGPARERRAAALRATQAPPTQPVRSPRSNPGSPATSSTSKVTRP